MYLYVFLLRLLFFMFFFPGMMNDDEWAVVFSVVAARTITELYEMLAFGMPRTPEQDADYMVPVDFGRKEY